MNSQLSENLNFHFYTWPTSALRRPVPKGWMPRVGNNSLPGTGNAAFYTLTCRWPCLIGCIPIPCYNCFETPNALTPGLPMFIPACWLLMRMLVHSMQVPLSEVISNRVHRCWGSGLSYGFQTQSAMFSFLCLTPSGGKEARAVGYDSLLQIQCLLKCFVLPHWSVWKTHVKVLLCEFIWLRWCSPWVVWMGKRREMSDFCEKVWTKDAVWQLVCAKTVLHPFVL